MEQSEIEEKFTDDYFVATQGRNDIRLKDIQQFLATEQRKPLEEFVKRVKPLMTTVADQETLDTFLKISLKESEAENETKNRN